MGREGGREAGNEQERTKRPREHGEGQAATFRVGGPTRCCQVTAGVELRQNANRCEFLLESSDLEYSYFVCVCVCVCVCFLEY